jgi:Meckel syndrome type 1 protein
MADPSISSLPVAADGTTLADAGALPAQVPTPPQATVPGHGAPPATGAAAGTPAELAEAGAAGLPASPAVTIPADPMPGGPAAQDRPATTLPHPGTDPAISQPIPGSGSAADAAPSQAQALAGMSGSVAVPAAEVAAAAPPAPRLAPPIHQIAPIVVALAQRPGQVPRLSVTLAPEQLGRVEIRIERDLAGDTTAIHVLAERPETLALLQRDARELDRALGQAGVTVAEGGMRFDLAGNDQASGGEPGARRQGGGRHRAPTPNAVAPQATRRGPALSLLDIAV